MTLYDSLMENCVRRTPNEATGGYSNGDSFSAAVMRDNSYESRVAERSEGRATYNITTQADLEYHEVFKRDATGESLRVVTLKKGTPSVASFSYKRYKAELFEEPEAEV